MLLLQHCEEFCLFDCREKSEDTCWRHSTHSPCCSFQCASSCREFVKWSRVFAATLKGEVQDHSRPATRPQYEVLPRDFIFGGRGEGRGQRDTYTCCRLATRSEGATLVTIHTLRRLIRSHSYDLALLGIYVDRLAHR